MSIEALRRIDTHLEVARNETTQLAQNWYGIVNRHYHHGGGRFEGKEKSEGSLKDRTPREFIILGVRVQLSILVPRGRLLACSDVGRTGVRRRPVAQLRR